LVAQSRHSIICQRGERLKNRAYRDNEIPFLAEAALLNNLVGDRKHEQGTNSMSNVAMKINRQQFCSLSKAA
jgi:hypothetical protein